MALEFEVGRPVVCIKTHSQGVVKEGDTFTLLDMRPGYCKCEELLLCVGHKRRKPLGMCRKCGQQHIPEGDDFYLSSTLFAPMDDWHEAECAIAELLDEVEEGQLIPLDNG